MNIDPVFPPIERARVVAELLLLVGGQRIRELFDVFRGEIVFVQENKRLEELNQLTGDKKKA